MSNHEINKAVSETARASKGFHNFDKDGKRSFITFLKNLFRGNTPMSAHNETVQFVMSITRSAPA